MRYILPLQDLMVKGDGGFQLAFREIGICFA
jgi:hypothetical protein